MKLSSPGFADHPLMRQTPAGSGRWGDFQFHETAERERYDYWVVLEGLPEPEELVCAPDGVIFVTWEPPQRTYQQRFIDQFASVVTCHPDLRHRDVRYSHQGHPWHVPKTYDELREGRVAQKTKLLSVIASNKSMYEGHRLRLDFAEALKKRLGDRVDFFGRGIREFEDKWEVLAPYRYSVAIENDFIPNWLTEKMPDCFLAETFPFYAGAPNARDYFPAESFIQIDISNPGRALDLIERTISDSSHFEKAVEHVRLAKGIYLERESLFPLLVRLLASRATSEATAEVVRLEPEDPRPRWRRALGRLRAHLR